MDKPSPLTELLRQAGTPTGGLLQRGHFLQRLNKLLQSLLDDNLKLHCQVGNIRDGVLILYSDSTAWASRLRYQCPALLKQLQQRRGLAELRQIEVKVQPKQHKETQHKPATLSEQASSCLSVCADTVADEKLSRALLRLASHHKG